MRSVVASHEAHPDGTARTRRSSRVACWLIASLAALPSGADDANACDVPGEYPDVIVGDLYDTRRWGSDGVHTAFSIATTSCNQGSCQVTWTSDTPDHPVIAQSLYRLKDGRLEQVGQSWLKHAFFAVSGNLCFTDCVGTDGTVLGVHCADPYSASFNGDQTTLGPKFEVNPANGEFPFPFTTRGETGGALYKRLQVRNVDLDPALNPGALYFVEGHYVNEDDATAGTDENNASYRPVDVLGANGAYTLDLIGITARTLPAIHAWAAEQPGVVLRQADVPGDGRLTVAVAVDEIAPGRYRYEYAVHNLNSHRAGRAFTVPLPAGALVENAGFHDVEYHSGEPFDATDWPVEVVRARYGDFVRWSTAAFDTDPDANALRWSTTYNFWFETDAPPSDGPVSLGLFRPGTPPALTWHAPAPRVCDADGACEAGESCANCAADCLGQLEFCCGDGACGSTESPCNCAADCGAPPGTEGACDDGLDHDCDGSVDCADADCCAAVACDSGVDADNDGFAGCDCNDGDPTVWEPPGEVPDLALDGSPAGPTVLTWEPPAVSGAGPVTYDIVRAIAPAQFEIAAACVVSDTDVRQALDADVPLPGKLYHYLARAENGCPAPGTLGRTSTNEERTARPCP